VCDDPYNACDGAAALVVLTEWPEFRELDLSKVASMMAKPAIIDTRNMLEPTAARAAGFSYVGTGRS
jgi:UDPglucose 6-dehydrogenase